MLPSCCEWEGYMLDTLVEHIIRNWRIRWLFHFNALYSFIYFLNILNALEFFIGTLASANSELLRIASHGCYLMFPPCCDWEGYMLDTSVEHIIRNWRIRCLFHFNALYSFIYFLNMLNALEFLIYLLKCLF